MEMTFYNTTTTYFTQFVQFCVRFQFAKTNARLQPIQNPAYNQLRYNIKSP